MSQCTLLGCGGGQISRARRHIEKLHGPVELSEGKPVAVWAYLVQEGFKHVAREGKSIEDEAKRAKWAIVWKLSWEELKDR